MKAQQRFKKSLFLGLYCHKKKTHLVEKYQQTLNKKIFFYLLRVSILMLCSSSFSYAQCTPKSFLATDVTTNQNTGCTPLTVNFNANISPPVAAEQLVEKFDVTFTKLYAHTTPPLLCGQKYRLRISGTFSFWNNTGSPDLDAAYRYLPPAGISNNNLISAPYNIRPDVDVPNTTNHTYDYCIIGKGCPMVISFSDAVYTDNSGILHYELYAEPTTFNYSWNFGDPSSGAANTSKLANPTHIFTNTGTYKTQVTITTNNSCTKDTATITCSYLDTTTITVSSTIPAKITGNTTICAGDSVTLTASGGKNYLWNTGNTTASITKNPLTDTIYSVLVSDNNCIDSAKTTIKVNPLPIANAGQDTLICFNNNLQLNASGGIKYQWSPAANLSNDTIYNPTLTTNTATQYIIKVTDQNNCIAYDSISINVDTTSLTVQFTPIAVTDYAPATIQFTNTTQGGSSYIWHFGESNTSNLQNPIYTYNTAGSYNIALIAYTNKGCVDTAYATILIQNNTSELWFPTAFTPNGDGLNDTFNAINIGLKDMKGLIFNRWGELIYEWNDMSTNKGWDGQYKNNDAPMGVYIYVINAADFDNKIYHKTGYVTLLR